MQTLITLLRRWSLIQQIILGLCLGAIIALLWPEAGSRIALLGVLFVGALKGIAPVLVFLLIIAAICQHKAGQRTNMRFVLGLYLIGTLLAAGLATTTSFLFPVSLHLTTAVTDATPPSDITGVLTTILKNIVDNPVRALMNGNYIGILGWGILFGIAFRHADHEIKNGLIAAAHAAQTVVHWVIRCAPLGIMGLVASSIAESGIDALLGYAKILALLLGTMLAVALILNPLIVGVTLKRNPYPLVLKCLRESGVTAFFTRSSAANIPVNMDLSKRLGIHPDTYSISIPLGATINMGGAAVTITVMTLAAVHTLGIPVDLPTAFLLSIIASVGACGTSGVAGGSLLLIPMACSLFGIDNDIAMQVVGVGFVIGVLQDSTETALNSSTDVLFTATADFAQRGHYPADRI